MADLDDEGPESSDDAHESPRVPLTDRKRGLVPASDSKPESERTSDIGGVKGVRL